MTYPYFLVLRLPGTRVPSRAIRATHPALVARTECGPLLKKLERHGVRTKYPLSRVLVAHFDAPDPCLTRRLSRAALVIGIHRLPREARRWLAGTLDSRC
jgi:hypothetical protein